MKDCCHALEIFFKLNDLHLSLQTDLNVKYLHIVSGESWLPDRWVENKNMSISSVDGP